MATHLTLKAGFTKPIAQTGAVTLGKRFGSALTVPKPRVNLTRFHGVFAPNSKYRAKVTLARRGKRKKCHSVDEADQTPAEKRASMAGFCSRKTGIHAIPGITWAKRLKRVFNIEIETCSECGGDVRIIASIA